MVAFQAFHRTSHTTSQLSHTFSGRTSNRGLSGKNPNNPAKFLLFSITPRAELQLAAAVENFHMLLDFFFLDIPHWFNEKNTKGGGGEPGGGWREGGGSKWGAGGRWGRRLLRTQSSVLITRYLIENDR